MDIKHIIGISKKMPAEKAVEYLEYHKTLQITKMLRLKREAEETDQCIGMLMDEIEKRQTQSDCIACPIQRDGRRRRERRGGERERMSEEDVGGNQYPSIFIRKGQKGGLYFFSPSGNYIFFGRSEDVKDVIDGKREWAQFLCRRVEKK